MNEVIDKQMQKALNKTSAEYVRWSPIWKKNNDVADGQEAIKENTTDYLPKTSLMSMLKNGDELYSAYLERAYFFNGTGRTIDGLVGLVYRNPLKIKLPTVMDIWANDMTMRKQSIKSISKICLNEVIKKNRVGLLVDYPIKKEIMSTLESQNKNFRPFVTIYKAECILDWDEEIIDNVYKTSYVLLSEKERKRTDLTISSVDKRRILDLVPFDNDIEREISKLEAGTNTEEVIEQIINSLPKYYRQRVFRKVELKEVDKETGKKFKWELESEFFPTDVKGNLFDYIPFIVITDKGLSWDLDYSMINDLANVNLSHYKNAADKENIDHVACNPTPCGIGLKSTQLSNPNIEEVPNSTQEKVSLGINTFLEFEDGGSWGMLEASGQGSQNLAASMKDKENQMALLGARILASDPSGIEAAETAEIHRSGEQGVLSSAVDAIDEGMKQSLVYMYRWDTGQEIAINEIIFELNKDFLQNRLEPAVIQTALQALQSNKISDQEFFMLMQKGEWIDSQQTFENHKKQIDEMKKNNPDNTNPFLGEIV